MSQPTLFPDRDDAWSQQMDLLRTALAMEASATDEWREFLALVKAMRDAQRYAEFGVAYSHQKRDRAERAVDLIIRELEELKRTQTLDFCKPASPAQKGGAQ